MTGHKVDTYTRREWTHIGAWFSNLAPISRRTSRTKCILNIIMLFASLFTYQKKKKHKIYS